MVSGYRGVHMYMQSLQKSYIKLRESSAMNTKVLIEIFLHAISIQSYIRLQHF